MFFLITVQINNNNNNGYFSVIFLQKAHCPFINKNSVNIKLRKPIENVDIHVTNKTNNSWEVVYVVKVRQLFSKHSQ